MKAANASDARTVLLGGYLCRLTVVVARLITRFRRSIVLHRSTKYYDSLASEWGSIRNAFQDGAQCRRPPHHKFTCPYLALSICTFLLNKAKP